MGAICVLLAVEVYAAISLARVITKRIYKEVESK